MRPRALLIAASLALTLACKPTVEGESREWSAPLAASIADVQDGAARVGREVAEIMSEAQPTTQAEASTILDEQIGRLNGSIKACEDTFDRLSKPDKTKTRPK